MVDPLIQKRCKTTIDTVPYTTDAATYETMRILAILKRILSSVRLQPHVLHTKLSADDYANDAYIRMTNRRICNETKLHYRWYTNNIGLYVKRNEYNLCTTCGWSGTFLIDI